MADLIAQGKDPAERWRRALPVQGVVLLGRSGEWAAAWDPLISRRHAELICKSGMLEVRRLTDARNPIFHRGREAQRFSLRPGEHFVIGDTTFTLLDDQVAATLDVPRPDLQETFTAADLKRLSYRDAAGRIDVLSRLGELFAGAGDRPQLLARVVNVLLVGVRSASAAALVAVDPAFVVLAWDRRRTSAETFAPSQRLILEAVGLGQSILHVWRGGGDQKFTATAQVDWAFATPLSGDACRGWAMYVEGRFAPGDAGEALPPAPSDIGPLREDLKFTEVVAAAVASWCDQELLRERQAALRPFFSPSVLSAIARDDPQRVLAPRPADVTVMFCDLRGFARASERLADDLMGLLERVSRALGVSTQQILDQGGVVGDFQGDSVMGFWGWPIIEPHGALLACRAARGIQRQCSLAAQEANHPLADFRVGIGIASGRAVAGQIGTAVQAKVTVFGPVANLASRLEGMTRTMGVDILIDEATANVLAAEPSEMPGRLRRLAVVRPYGIEKALTVSQLLSPEEECPEITAASLNEYEAALALFISGEWPAARERLRMLSNMDAAAAYLLGFIEEGGAVPPPDWDGVIRLKNK